MRQQFVYAIRGGGYVKIGVAKNPQARLEGFQTGCPYKLRLIATARGNWHTERSLHERFADRRVRGEWFKLSDDEVLEEFAALPQPRGRSPRQIETPSPPTPRDEVAAITQAVIDITTIHEFKERLAHV